MPLSPGTGLSNFEIEALIGAGGMGEVYRARDTKLRRVVALKILPEALSKDLERLHRFEREARLLASLSHRNVATLHDLSESGGVRFLVMELVDGDTLAERIRRGAVPVPEALPLFVQLAEGLEAAHRKGIVHRDLKPANIKVTPQGQVKVLDFGLAKALPEDDPPADLSSSPTRTRGTESGIILGTAAYMSPEQVRGQEVDARADIWAFGCVVYETLTGRPPFRGPTLADTLAAVLERQPDWRPLPKETPPLLRSVVRRCLEKDPERRVHDIADARIEIEEILREPRAEDAIVPAPERPRRHSLWPAIALLSLLLGGFLSWAVQLAPSVSKEVMRLSLETAGQVLVRPPLLSPNGERVVYATTLGLVVRELDKSEGRLIPGTWAARFPFFSPDGMWLGYSDESDSSLKKVSLSGGVPLRVCRCVEESRGADWGPDDTIVFTQTTHSGLWQVSAMGGEPLELTRPDRARGEKTHRFPRYLPGGKAVLFTVGTTRLSSYDDARIDVLPLQSGRPRTLIEGGTGAAYLGPGYLLYRRASSILAAPFDIEHLLVTGPPVAVLDGVGVESNSTYNGEALFSVSRTGTLAYMPNVRSAQRLVMVDRAGQTRPLSPFVDFLAEPRLSPDGSAIALRRPAANDQVWRFDVERQSFSKITFEWDNLAPVWTPDGKFLIVMSSPGYKLHRVLADGSGSAEPLSMPGGRSQRPGSVAPDGSLLAYSATGMNTKSDIWIGSSVHESKSRVFLETPADESLPAIAPNGRLLAYQSDESGQDEIYVRSFPDGVSKVQVSAGGGIQPVWSRNGKELFYRKPVEERRQRMMVADVSAGSPIRASPARSLFEESYRRLGNGPAYDVFPDGQHFVMIEVDWEASHIRHFNVVLNWSRELQRLVPLK